MSALTAVCRVCLAVDVRLLTMAESMQGVYEKLTDNALHTADGKPVTACYICYAQLNKCRKLMQTSARAENVLNAIVYCQSEITVKSVSLMDRRTNGLCGSLTESGVKCFDSLQPAPVDIKMESETDVCNIEIENMISEGSPQPAAKAYNETECDSDKNDLISLVQPCDKEINIKNEVETEEEFAPQLNVTVSIVKDENSCSDDDSSPWKSLRAETQVEAELWEDGASAQISGADKQKQTQKGVTSRIQQRSRRYSRNQTGEGRHECVVCKRRFKFQCQLKIHLRAHTSEKPYECDICHSKLSAKSSLKSHLKIHTRDKSNLKSHTGNKPYICNICYRGFFKKASLINHLRTHTGQMPYECNVCQHKFYKSSNLTNHLRTHTGEKLFQCEVCQHGFSDRSTLIRHFKTHTGEKLFECSVCQRRFNRNYHLEQHLRTHTGEKPYQCNVCGKQFRQRPSLKLHLRTHTGEKPYGCDICQRRFSRLHHYEGHLKTHTDKKQHGHFEKRIVLEVPF